MSFVVVYRNASANKLAPVAMGRPGHVPRARVPANAKIIVMDKKTGKVIENATIAEVDGDIVVTAEQGGHTEVLILENGRNAGIALLNGAVASEFVASSPASDWAELLASSDTLAPVYIAGGLAAAGGGLALGLSSDKTPPVFTSGANGKTLVENAFVNSEVYVAQATDKSGKVTYALKAGSDAALSIDPITGKVTLNSSPDFETKSSYSFTVIATDAAGNSAEQTVSFAIANLDERAPTITSAASAGAIAENSGAGQVVYNAAATDTDFVAPGTATSITWSLKPGSDAGLTIDAQTGKVTLVGNPDYETRAGYTFTVIATDAAGNASEKTVTLAIANRDEVAPTITSAASADTIAENSGSGQVVYTAAATDSDFIAPATASSISWSLKPGSDAGLTIDAQTGQVTLVGNPDYEAHAGYTFTVVATDAAGNASEKTVTLAIANRDEVAPTFTSAISPVAIAENSGAGQVVFTATATDTDFVAPGTATSIMWSLKPGSDAGLTIDAQTGKVTLVGNPDYETRAGYTFTVVATDAAGNAREKAVTVAIANRDEVAPTITSGSGPASIAENSGAGQIVYTFAATDTDFVAPATASAVTWSLKPGSDAGLAIDAQTGKVTLTDNPDHETKDSYSFTAVAKDAAGNASEQAATIYIANRDEVAPTINSATSGELAVTNSSVGQLAYTATATDTDFNAPDTAQSITWSLGENSDAGLAIDAKTGAVERLPCAPDALPDSYHFTVIATDAAGNRSTQDVTLDVTLAAQIVYVLGEGYPNLVDGGDGVFNGWSDYGPRGDDLSQSTTPGDASYIDFANKTVTVKFLSLPESRPLDISGFGEDDRIEIILMEMPQSYYGSYPIGAIHSMNQVNFNNTAWRPTMVTQHYTGAFAMGYVARHNTGRTYAKLAITFLDMPPIGGGILFNWKNGTAPTDARSANVNIALYYNSPSQVVDQAVLIANTVVYWPELGAWG